VNSLWIKSFITVDIKQKNVNYLLHLFGIHGDKSGLHVDDKTIWLSGKNPC